mmetsp:Transcript_5289/g.14918  ORF Transcript_5289/g.14918 Transcript_5289/m.14918 type:complete len:174 (-) Transcript_5289:904-1425(-)
MSKYHPGLSYFRMCSRLVVICTSPLFLLSAVWESQFPACTYGYGARGESDEFVLCTTFGAANATGHHKLRVAGHRRVLPRRHLRYVMTLANTCVLWPDQEVDTISVFCFPLLPDEADPLLGGAGNTTGGLDRPGALMVNGKVANSAFQPLVVNSVYKLAADCTVRGAVKGLWL